MRISALTLALALAVVVLALVAKPALAATIAVNTTDDEDNNNGLCSLREAIIAANTNAVRDACQAGSSSVTDTINVPAGSYRLTRATADAAATPDATTADLDVLGRTTIIGAGARATTVSADSSLGSFKDRIFEIHDTSTTTIRGLTIKDGNGSPGGGVENNTGTLTLDKVAIIQNVSTRGGGVASFGNSTVDTLTITNSTVWANQSTSESTGGVIQEGGTAFITNSTISGNVGRGVTATDFFGNDGTSHIMTIQNSTIANNRFNEVAHRNEIGGGIRANNVGMVVNVKNTIVSGNDKGNCDPFFGGKIKSQGNNIDSANTCGFAQATDKRNTNPKLGPLENNGGTTDTHALLKSSPAINAGGKDFPARDQRGVKRPQGNRSDIGAYEKEQ